MDYPLLSQIEQFPVEVQVNWFKNLTIVDLLSVYHVSQNLRHVLNRKDVIQFLSEDKAIETWYNFVISKLSLLTPLQLYKLHSNKNLKPYMNDLRITIKFVVFGMSFQFYRKRDFTMDDVIESLELFASKQRYPVASLITKIDKSYQQPVRFRDDKIIIDEPVTNSATQGKRGVLGTNCGKLSRLVLLNILERTDHNIVEFINHNKSQLCIVVQDYAKSIDNPEDFY
jgi:hypothetical protein